MPLDPLFYEPAAFIENGQTVLKSRWFTQHKDKMKIPTETLRHELQGGPKRKTSAEWPLERTDDSRGPVTGDSLHKLTLEATRPGWAPALDAMQWENANASVYAESLEKEVREGESITRLESLATQAERLRHYMINVVLPYGKHVGPESIQAWDQQSVIPAKSVEVCECFFPSPIPGVSWDVFKQLAVKQEVSSTPNPCKLLEDLEKEGFSWRNDSSPQDHRKSATASSEGPHVSRLSSGLGNTPILPEEYDGIKVQDLFYSMYLISAVSMRAQWLSAKCLEEYNDTVTQTLSLIKSFTANRDRARKLLAKAPITNDEPKFEKLVPQASIEHLQTRAEQTHRRLAAIVSLCGSEKYGYMNSTIHEPTQMIKAQMAHIATQDLTDEAPLIQHLPNEFRQLIVSTGLVSMMQGSLGSSSLRPTTGEKIGSAPLTLSSDSRGRGHASGSSVSSSHDAKRKQLAELTETLQLSNDAESATSSVTGRPKGSASSKKKKHQKKKKSSSKQKSSKETNSSMEPSKEHESEEDRSEETPSKEVSSRKSEGKRQELKLPPSAVTEPSAFGSMSSVRTGQVYPTPAGVEEVPHWAVPPATEADRLFREEWKEWWDQETKKLRQRNPGRRA